MVPVVTNPSETSREEPRGANELVLTSPDGAQAPSQPCDGGEDLSGDQGSFCTSAQIRVLVAGMGWDAVWLCGGLPGCLA